VNSLQLTVLALRALVKVSGQEKPTSPDLQFDATTWMEYGIDLVIIVAWGVFIKQEWLRRQTIENNYQGRGVIPTVAIHRTIKAAPLVLLAVALSLCRDMGLPRSISNMQTFLIAL
jgi:hypothetical protein